MKIMVCGEAKFIGSNDATKSFLNVEKTENGLGWSPKTDLREGIRQTLKWWAGAFE
jgi:nucleoside-diphosphate-sugar epimerase